MRVAWFSPMPPDRTGVAAVSADLVSALAAEHAIDVFADVPIQHATDGRRSVHEFVWLHRRQPYELTVYQLGNSAHHDFEWPYVFRYPGLAVLHDAHLHHARAACLLKDGREADYRAELSANHPAAPAAVAELAVAGFANNVYYRWPMTTLVAVASRLTAVHTPVLADRLRADVPGAAVAPIRLGHGINRGAAFVERARYRVRAERRIPSDAVVFGVFGGMTPEKRVPQILEAFGSLARERRDVHLLLAGAQAPYFDLLAEVGSRGLGSSVTVTGYLEDDEELDAHIAACDAALMLRWPTAREVSGPWLRALALGIATVITDLEHLSDVPALRPSTDGIQDSGIGSRPVSIALDLADEYGQLAGAIGRLATDAGLRERLGAAGQQYWEREHSPQVMVEDYRRVMALAARLPVPRVKLPRHLTESGDERLRALAAVFADDVTDARLSPLLKR